MLERDSVPPRVAGMFYQAVVASVLLYGSESWVVLPSALRYMRIINTYIVCASEFLILSQEIVVLY